MAAAHLLIGNSVLGRNVEQMQPTPTTRYAICLASGSFSFNAPRDFTGNVLELRGSFRSIVDRRIPGWGQSLDENEFHPGTEQYRFGTGPSPHFSLPDNPKNTVPTVGPFHVDKDAPGLQHLGCAKLGVGCQ
jgi:hypothetical protein